MCAAPSEPAGVTEVEMKDVRATHCTLSLPAEDLIIGGDRDGPVPLTG